MDKKSSAGPGDRRDPGDATGRPPAGSRAPRDFPDVPRVSRAVVSHSQRVSPRKVLPCSLMLRNGATYVMARAIHDISLVGALVEIDVTGLVPGASVELVLEFSDGRRNTDLQLSAEVVRVDSQGVALRFGDYGDQTYTDLVNLLYTH